MTPVPVATPVMDMATPDWADDQTKEELAAQYQEDIGDDSDDDGDPYGVLDFEANFDSDDEAELRKSIGGYRLGAWMDGLVDVFLRLEDDFPGSQVDDSKDKKGKGEESSAPDSDSAKKDAEAASGLSVRLDDSVEPPPERPKSVWDDVAWFGRLVARAVQS